MEPWRVHKLEKVLDSGERTQIGGAILALNIVGFNGSLSEVSIKPVPEEERKEFSSEAYVRLQVADRIVWLGIEETEVLIDLLRLSLNEATAPS